MPLPTLCQLTMGGAVSFKQMLCGHQTTETADYQADSHADLSNWTEHPRYTCTFDIPTEVAYTNQHGSSPVRFVDVDLIWC